MKGIVGFKVGMTQIYAEDGTFIPVTIVQATPGTVLGKTTMEKNEYTAIKVGFVPLDEKQQKRMNKPEAGVFKKAGVAPQQVIREFRVDEKEAANYNVGDQIKVDIFRKGQFVDVTGTTKGRGFQGVFKRWGMKGAARDSASSHEHHRHIGAVGQRKTPGKVWKGKHLPGHYGVETVTVQNLQVVDVDPEHHLLLIKGAIPGHNEALVTVYPNAKLKADRAIVHAEAAEEGEEEKKGAKPAAKKK